jgi:hypothetical protein
MGEARLCVGAHGWDVRHHRPELIGKGLPRNDDGAQGDLVPRRHGIPACDIDKSRPPLIPIRPGTSGCGRFWLSDLVGSGWAWAAGGGGFPVPEIKKKVVRWLEKGILKKMQGGPLKKWN